MKRLPQTLTTAPADHIDRDLTAFLRALSSSVLLTWLLRTAAWVFLVCLTFWALWFFWFADRHPLDK